MALASCLMLLCFDRLGLASSTPVTTGNYRRNLSAEPRTIITISCPQVDDQETVLRTDIEFSYRVEFGLLNATNYVPVDGAEIVYAEASGFFADVAAVALCKEKQDSGIDVEHVELGDVNITNTSTPENSANIFSITEASSCVIQISSSPNDHMIREECEPQPDVWNCFLFEGSLTVVHNPECSEEQIQQEVLLMLDASMEGGDFINALNDGLAGTEIVATSVVHEMSPAMDFEARSGPELDELTEIDERHSTNGLTFAGFWDSLGTVTPGGWAVVAAMVSALIAFFIVSLLWCRSRARYKREVEKRLDNEMKSVRTDWSDTIEERNLQPPESHPPKTAEDHQSKTKKATTSTPWNDCNLNQLCPETGDICGMFEKVPQDMLSLFARGDCDSVTVTTSPTAPTNGQDPPGHVRNKSLLQLKKREETKAKIEVNSPVTKAQGKKSVEL